MKKYVKSDVDYEIEKVTTKEVIIMAENNKKFKVGDLVTHKLDTKKEKTVYKVMKDTGDGFYNLHNVKDVRDELRGVPGSFLIKADDEEGVWRTIMGRRVFIPEGTPKGTKLI